MNKKVRLLSKFLLLPFLFSTINPVTCLSMENISDYERSKNYIPKSLYHILCMNGVEMENFAHNPELYKKKLYNPILHDLIFWCVDEKKNDLLAKFNFLFPPKKIEKVREVMSPIVKKEIVDLLYGILKEIYSIMGLNSSEAVQIYKPYGKDNNIETFIEIGGNLIDKLLCMSFNFSEVLEESLQKGSLGFEATCGVSDCRYLFQHNLWVSGENNSKNIKTEEAVIAHCKKVDDYLLKLFIQIMNSVDKEGRMTNLELGFNKKNIKISVSSKKM